MLQADEAVLLFLIYWWRNEAWRDICTELGEQILNWGSMSSGARAQQPTWLLKSFNVNKPFWLLWLYGTLQQDPTRAERLCHNPADWEGVVCLSMISSYLNSTSLFKGFELHSKLSAQCCKLQIKSCILEHFLFSHPGRPYWRQQIYTKAKQLLLLSPVLVGVWLMTAVWSIENITVGMKVIKRNTGAYILKWGGGQSWISFFPKLFFSSAVPPIR